MNDDLPKVDVSQFAKLVTEEDETYTENQIKQDAEKVLSGKSSNIGHPLVYNVFRRDDGRIYANFGSPPCAVRLMDKKEEFLDAASDGTERMRNFVKERLESVESGNDNHIVGSHYSIKRIDNEIMAKVLIHSEKRFRDYAWEIPKEVNS